MGNDKEMFAPLTREVSYAADEFRGDYLHILAEIILKGRADHESCCLELDIDVHPFAA